MFDSSAPAAYPQCYPCHDALRPRHRRAGPASSTSVDRDRFDTDRTWRGSAWMHASVPPARGPRTGPRHSTN